ncbi:hydantoinase/oxoprolinase family protein [Desulfobacula sp.]|uniref:hydantoinase/oxoprolinase family protein n=1 Tax=Desulfobacula sp. TaxID=2593537 RepID=UPI00260F517B|nr:hydantoinase/oxoprolinase family protein [Desulfobacula sp.]
MGYTIDIDTGGTFTDGLFTDGKVIKKVKVDSTPHDLTVSWYKCIEEGTKAFGFTKVEDFLEQVEIIRWSNTFASNVVAERKGPKLGMFVTNGHQKDLYTQESDNPVFGHLIDENDVVGIEYPFTKKELLFQVKAMLEKGVRRVCVSLKDGLKHSKQEDDFKEIFEGQYPDHYLGNVPLLSAKELCKHPDDMTRTNYALLNAYVHGPMATAMFKAEDMLREKEYKRPLLLGKIDGGVAKVPKTKPVDTIESGPIFGLHAGKYWADVYQLPNVFAFDVGGTTSKFGTIENGRLGVTNAPNVFGIPLKQQMADLRSIALGGGTIAKVVNEKLRLGPESMGAYPGPACYDLGGTEPTLTDALLIKGIFDIDYFAGGTKTIDLMRAQKIIAEKIAEPLGISLILAAERIVDLATDMLADVIKSLIQTTGKSANDFSLFGYGGNGAILSCEVAEKVGMKTVYMFDLGSVFSCVGSSVADISHTYEYAPYLWSSEKEAIIKQLTSMGAESARDMTGEGFPVEKVDAVLDLTVRRSDNDQEKETIQLQSSCNLSEFSADPLLTACLAKGPDSCFLELLKLQVMTPALKVQLKSKPHQGKDSSSALKSERKVYSKDINEVSKIYQWEDLTVGNLIKGRAIIEGTDTTYFVPENWHLQVDGYNNAVIKRQMDA